MPDKAQRSYMVETVHPFGIFVRSAEGEQAYIRCRELSLSGDIDPRTLVHPGEMIEAEVLSPARNNKYAELSVRRRLQDPWPSFARTHRVGDVVRVKVKYISEDGIRTEVEPGVEGVVAWSELTVKRDVRSVQGLVWLDDCLEALITDLDPHARELHLSVRQWLIRLSAFEPVLQGFYAARGQVIEEGTAGPEVYAPSGITQLLLRGEVLVVDDEEVLRSSLVEWLATMGCRAVPATSARQALSLCAHNNYALVLADLNMPHMDGLTLIRQLRGSGWEQPIAVMSTPDTIALKLPALRKLAIAAVFAKPLDREEITRFLFRLADGDVTTLPLGDMPPNVPGDAARFQRLATDLQHQQSASDRLEYVLTWLVHELHADKGIVFRLEPSAKEVRIAAECGSGVFVSAMLRDLIYSPISDVIRSGLQVWENNVSVTSKARFRHLRAALSFESCIGIRLQAAGQHDHALFLFAADPDSFPAARLRVAQTAAALIDAALERKVFEDLVFSLGGLFTSGQRASQLGHEVNNKVSGLDLQISVLRTRFEELKHTVAAGGDLADSLHGVGDALAQTEKINAELMATVGGFHRFMHAADDDKGDVNQAVAAAHAQLKTLAEQKSVDIRLELDPGSLTTHASSTRLQLVIYNIMLNAVQHMAEHAQGRRVLTVTTRQSVWQNESVLQVRISDTGPGIHRRLWERIFEPGYTTRKEGSGLGLFITRMLLAPANGSVTVEESVILLGTTFLVQVPALHPAISVRE
jgi:signal transduction histidine kinase/DNA-binding NarL/FixJ family response regulator/predicted RNA-binding protein with RPS1 domain